MNTNIQIETAIKEQDLHTDKYQSHAHVITNKEHNDIYSVIKQPKVFPKVEYSKCVTIIDNR